ncbi:Ras 5 [Dorcoceras hygrometricum]|uniref:Ras 5 n=1 Tax=Dorcoceras hygrometricum TaxID=472368 RepID=A0A2Z7C3A8_9LAMI|nr:Ras 5 [Dorcoceras hygrometricum]
MRFVVADFVQAVTCSHLRGIGILVIFAQKDARASGDTALTSPCWDLLATMSSGYKYLIVIVKQI